MFTKEELARVKLLEQQQLGRLAPRLQVVSRLGVRGAIQVVQPDVIQLKAFQRVNVNKLFIHPVWPEPIPVQNRRD